ncbi:MAG: alpha/beta hydrolase [Clostridia bacterium]|nr:alpha/beta hydrolase [Clostridia bacterium]
MKQRIKTIGFYTWMIVIFGSVLGLNYILDNLGYSYVITLLVAAGLIYIRHKHFLKGIKYTGVCLLAIVISFFSLMYGRPDLSISFRGNLVNEVGKFIVHTYNDITGANILGKILSFPAKPYDFTSWTAPKGYENKEIKLSQSRAYLLSKNNSKHDKVIYQIHGGAYILTFVKSYNETAVRYSNAYDGADVFSLDYRTAPINLYPKALDDAMEGYKWLLEQGYKADDIIVAGDSAGAGLSLAMTLKLRDAQKALPKMLILSSPWADLSAEGESYKTKIQADAFFGSSDVSKELRYPVPITYAGNNDLHNPYISPAYANYQGLPPMLIQTGSEELLLSDSKTVAEKAKTAGVDVKFIEYNGMYHIFYIATPNIPEGRKAWKKIEEFIHR